MAEPEISFNDLIATLDGTSAPATVSGVSETASACMVAALYAASPQAFCVVVENERAAATWASALGLFLPNRDAIVHVLPAYNLMPYKTLTYHNEISARRIRTLYHLLNTATPPILVVSVAGWLQRLMPADALVDFSTVVRNGMDLDRDHFLATLIAGGYHRTALVEEPGDFAVRGGLVDVFSPLYPEPVRIEWFGDQVDRIRFFSPSTQRMISEVGEATVLPARESLVFPDQVPEIVNRVRVQATEQSLPVSVTRQMVARVRNEGAFPGIDSLLPLMYPALDTVKDYLPDHCRVVLSERAQLDEAAGSLHHRAETLFDRARTEKRLAVPPNRLYMSWSEMMATAKRPIAVTESPVRRPDHDPTRAWHMADTTDNAVLTVAMTTQGRTEGHYRPLIEWLQEQTRHRRSVALVCRTETQAKRLVALLAPYDIPIEMQSPLLLPYPSPPGVWCGVGNVVAGMVWSSAGIAILTAEELFGDKRQRQPTAPLREARDMITVEDLQVADLVVHSEHGIGRFMGLTKLQVGRAINEFLQVAYRDDDKLYVPVDRMTLVQKYIGVEDAVPALDKMGGKSWDRIRARVKRSAEKIAGELLSLYAARRVASGHAFDDFGKELDDFVAGFAYEETPDQIVAIEKVLDDMARPTPMDRLICGDVGYGKTEIALRAAFVAVAGGRQVAMVVPTTVLAQQHYETFCERFKRFPVNIACLNRFRSAREQRDIVQRLTDGRVDIVVGTHRLLQKDIAFGALGLAIIDEEQRFGVRHKERLKSLRKSVDVLALTATPIPRTLHLSLMGIRDISVISTPPEQRKAIVTYVCPYEDALVTDAVNKELARGGQVFFVHNVVATIDAMAGKLADLIPESRIGVAHGQMSAETLEKAMMAFATREIDILVCTTIIESGLDIPSANTLIVNRADRFGLAQMYQLRGRVGRGDAQAYAYLFIPHEESITRDAQKRLKVLMEHSDLGAGFQIAMSDLKIRGGGTILGASQSGHIAAVGYDMFLQLMETAVAEARGEPTAEPLEPEILLPESAHLPSDYIPDLDQRLTVYRRLARMRELSQIADLKSELIDRFGPLPDEAGQLLLKIMLRVLAIAAGVQRLEIQDARLALTFSRPHMANPDAVIIWITDQGGRCRLLSADQVAMKLTARDPLMRLAETKNALKEIGQRVNG